MVSSVDKEKRSGVTTKRTIVFGGNQEEWDAFYAQWLAINSHRGWSDILDGTEAVPTKTEVDAANAKTSLNNDDKDLLERHEKNVECFNMLLISMDASKHAGRLAFYLVNTCKRPEYPKGNSKLAWDKLISKYAPKNVQTELSLRKKFANTRLDMNSDPDDFMMKVEVTAMDINAMTKQTSNITDYDIMAHVLNNLPSNYDAITDGMERQFNEGTLTLDILREKLQSRFTRLARIEDEEEDYDTNLMVINKFRKKFKGVCWVCGRRGQKSSECEEKKKEEKANVAVDEESDEESLGF